MSWFALFYLYTAHTFRAKLTIDQYTYTSSEDLFLLKGVCRIRICIYFEKEKFENNVKLSCSLIMCCLALFVVYQKKKN